MDSYCMERAKQGSDSVESSIKKTGSRIQWIDICKGIAIVLMILGHIKGKPPAFNTVIFSFHMPLFFIVNGYLIRNYNIVEGFKKASRSLVKPYVIICMLETLLAVFRTETVESAGTELFASLNDMVMGMSKISTSYKAYRSVWLVWFVVCLFVTRMMYILIRNITNNRWIQDGIIVVVALLGYYIGTQIAFLPWSLDVAMVSLLFMAFGDCLRGHWFNGKKQFIIFAASLAIWIILMIHGAQLELAMRKYPQGVLCLLCAIAGSMVSIFVGKGIERLRVSTAIWSWLGKNSLVILAVHCLEMRFFKWNEWVYSPLGIVPAWAGEFAIHLAFILLVTWLFTLVRTGFRKLDETLRRRESGADEQRLEWPDVAKGICMICIVLGHMTVDWINRFVYMFHLPVFFLISGYFLKHKDDEMHFARGKAKRLLVPYAITCAVACVVGVVRAACEGTDIQATVLKWLNAAVYGAGNHWKEPYVIRGIGAIWYLWALFFALIIVNHCVERKHYQAVIAAVALVGWTSYNATKVWAPLSIQAGMLACGYLLIGYECRKYRFDLMKPGLAVVSGMFLLTVFDIQHFRGLYLVHNYLGNGWLDFFASISASFIVIRVAIHICERNEWLKRTLSFFGRHSLLMLCVHHVELEAWPFKTLLAPMFASLNLNANHELVLLAFMKLLYITVVTGAIVMIKKWLTSSKQPALAG